MPRKHFLPFARRVFRNTLLAVATSVALASCRHLEPLVTTETDRTGWVEVGRVPAVSVARMQRVMIESGIPAWFDAAGYPYYPVTVPPEYRERATQILSPRGYAVRNDASKWTIELASSNPSPSGPCRIYDDLHRLMLDGTLASAKMDGTWTSTGSDGTRLATWSYRQGVRQGAVQMWYGSHRYPGSAGHLKLEGAFANGEYDGAVTRYYPSGTKQSVRLYERGVIKSSRHWSPGGAEKSPSAAATEADFEHKQDLAYLSTLEDMVARSLAQARREIRH